jgi:hypothetical protein
MWGDRGGAKASPFPGEGRAAQTVDHAGSYTPAWGGWEGKISPVRIFSSKRPNVAKSGQPRGQKILTRPGLDSSPQRSKNGRENAAKSKAYAHNAKGRYPFRISHVRLHRQHSARARKDLGLPSLAMIGSMPPARRFYTADPNGPASDSPRILRTRCVRTRSRSRGRRSR